MSNAKNEFTFWRDCNGGAIIIELTDDGKFKSVSHNGSSGSYPKDESVDFAKIWLKEALNLDIKKFKKIADSINRNSMDYLILLDVVNDKINQVQSEYNVILKELNSIL